MGPLFMLRCDRESGHADLITTIREAVSCFFTSKNAYQVPQGSFLVWCEFAIRA